MRYAIICRSFYIKSNLFVWSTQEDIGDEDTAFTSSIVQAILHMLNCRMKIISSFNHGSSKVERKIKTISEIIIKHLWNKGQMWPLFATTASYIMNTIASEALSSFSLFQLVFLRDPSDLTSLTFPKIPIC